MRLLCVGSRRLARRYGDTVVETENGFVGAGTDAPHRSNRSAIAYAHFAPGAGSCATGVPFYRASESRRNAWRLSMIIGNESALVLATATKL